MQTSLPIIVTIIVLLFLAFFMVKGFIKGFLRILFTTFALVVTIVISALITTPVATFLNDSTDVGTWVETAVSSYVDKRVDEETMELEEKQDEFIDSLALPEFIKAKLGSVDVISGTSLDFKDYITGQLTSVIMKAITFVAVGIIIYILLRIIFKVLNIITRIPILRGINRFLGGLLGLAEGLLILWCICCLIMAFSATDIATDAMEIISQGKVLSFIYDNNLLISGVHAVFKLF